MVGTFARAAIAFALAAAALCVLSSGGAPAAPLGGAAGAAFAPLPSVSAGCSAPWSTSSVAGTLSIDGGPAGAASVAGVALTIGYYAPWSLVDTVTGRTVSSGCSSVAVPTTTSAQGVYSVGLGVPAPTCTAPNGGDLECVEYGGPDGPVSVVPSAGPPAGYAFSVGSSGTPFVLPVSFVWELAYVTLAPSTPVLTLSAGAPVTLTASGWMANGTPTPLAPTFAWSVEGAGWTLLDNGSGPSTVVVGEPGAALGTVGVVARASVGGTGLVTPSAAISLASVPTGVVAASANRTSTDVGGPVLFRLNATGAAGYSYTGAVDPGLGQPQVPLLCASGPGTLGTVTIACTASVAYGLPGTAQPSATVTNGYSSASWTYPAVQVAAAPLLSVVGERPGGYPGMPVELRVAVANDTGTAPFSPACLDPGIGSPLCSSAPGPLWTFSPVYPSAGLYRAHAWVWDASGASGVVSFVVSVTAPPAIGPVSVTPNAPTVGVASRLTATLSGGALPARYWWNVSSVAGPWSSGSVTADGPLATTFLPAYAGTYTVSLTVADAFGTVVRAAVVVSVAPAPATTVALWSAAPTAPVVVGHGVALAWAALDLEGNPARGFSGPAVLRVAVADGAPRAWANASGVGALSASSDGAFSVPAAAWVGGVLNVTLVPGTAGTYTVSLAGAALPNTVPSQRFTAVADSAHVRLFAPAVALALGRQNSTFWHVADRFGNAVPGAVLLVRSLAGASSGTLRVAAVAIAGGGSGVWINYSLPGADAGSVAVVDAAGVTVLGPLVVAAALPAAPAVPLTVLLSTFVPVGAAGVVVAAVVRRRRPGRLRPADEDGELRQLAEGRDRVVAILREHGPCDITAIEAAWGGPPPGEPLTDWLASLVADGTLGATLGPDRVARFCLSRSATPLQVELDTRLLEEALRRRDAETRGD